MKTYSAILCACLIFVLPHICCGCSENTVGAIIETPEEQTGLTMQDVDVTFPLGQYYGDTGELQQALWQSGDSVPLCVLPANRCPFVAEVKVPGAVSSTARVALPSPAKGILMSYFPDTINMQCSGYTLTTTIPTVQDGSAGPMMVGFSAYGELSGDSQEIKLEQFPATLYVTLPQGNYSVSHITVKSNAGESLAGTVDIRTALGGGAVAKESAVEVRPANGADCHDASRVIPVVLAPVELSAGFAVTVHTTTGQTVTTTEKTKVNLARGGRYDVTVAPDKLDDIENPGSSGPELAVCGEDRVLIIDGEKAMASDYHDAVLWSWNAGSVSAQLGLDSSRLNHIDDCKPVDNGTKLLVTSSYGWCVMIDRATGTPEFYTAQTPQAHSAELLPGNLVAVACSSGSGDGYNTVQLYSAGTPGVKLAEYPLASAHGVVWNDTTQRLYAAGGGLLQIYRLDYNSDGVPMLVLEKNVTTPEGGVHDLTRVSGNTLCVAGNKCYLYNISSNNFMSMKLFVSSTALKSVNYNDSTGEVWFTDATVPEGTQTWSTQTLRWASSVSVTSAERTIKIPDMDVYKVRVVSWGNQTSDR